MLTTFGWGGPKRLIIDTYSGAAGAYSFRRLSAYYNGPAMRVRRDSDNSEQDIYFDLNGNFDITSFNTFKSAANCYIKTWYDQTGNGRHFTQTTFANQPKCDGTQLILDGQSTGVNKFLKYTGGFFTYTGAGSVYAVASWANKNSGASNSIQTLYAQFNTSTDCNWFGASWAFVSGLIGWLTYGVAGNNIQGSKDHNINQFYALNLEWTNFSTYITNGNTKFRFNDIESSPYTPSGSNPSTLGSAETDLFKGPSNFTPYSMEGKCKEIIFYPLNNSNALSSNIRKYYGI